VKILMMNVLLYALQYYGLKEIKGGENPEIVNFAHELGYEWVWEDETPWCASFVMCCAKRCNYEFINTLHARDCLNVGEVVQKPVLGDLVIFWRNDPEGEEGHVGFFISEKGNYIYVYSGNQGNQVKISLYKKSKVLGYRRLRKLA